MPSIIYQRQFITQQFFTFIHQVVTDMVAFCASITRVKLLSVLLKSGRRRHCMYPLSEHGVSLNAATQVRSYVRSHVSEQPIILDSPSIIETYPVAW
jgi:hypothetical protein